MSKTRLPPLAALEAFAAAARLGSFTRAAQQRHMTHSGVSRHVQTVEHWCEEALFTRNGPQLALTEAGHALLARLADPLEQLHQALQAPKRTTSVLPLHIRTLPSIASTWLLPKLASFTMSHPSIALSLHVGYEMTDLPPHLPCIALRYGVFNHEGLETIALGNERMVPAAWAAWLRRHGRDPARWPANQMLRHLQTPWPTRLLKGKDQRVRLPVAEGIEMNDALLLLQAAATGLGVVWARARMLQSFIDRGELVALDAWSQASDRQYWLAYRAELADHQAIHAFCQWAQINLATSEAK
jgi:LysR family transcriptional regulator, glycine cleavage system transcriptional activator